MAPVVAYLHFTGGTKELIPSIRRKKKTNYFTGETRDVTIFRLANPPYAYEWDSDDLVDIGDEVAVPGGMYISNMIAARDWALGRVVHAKRRSSASVKKRPEQLQREIDKVLNDRKRKSPP